MRDWMLQLVLSFPFKYEGESSGVINRFGFYDTVCGGVIVLEGKHMDWRIVLAILFF